MGVGQRKGRVGRVGEVVEVGLCLLEGFFLCVERPQRSNLFHIPKTNQAGYFHSGTGLMAEVGLKRVGRATRQHIKALNVFKNSYFILHCTYSLLCVSEKTDRGASSIGM